MNPSSSTVDLDAEPRMGLPAEIDSALDVYSISCVDVMNTVPRLVGLFRLLGVAISNLSTWHSVGVGPGLLVVVARPLNLPGELLVKRINRLVGVTKVKCETALSDRQTFDVAIEISATGHYIEKLVALGVRHDASLVEYSKKRVVLEVIRDFEDTHALLSRVEVLARVRMPGEIRLTTTVVPSAGRVSCSAHRIGAR